jgi:hypothetical protein
MRRHPQVRDQAQDVGEQMLITGLDRFWPILLQKSVAGGPEQ